MSLSPTSLSLARLREEGWVVEVVERWAGGARHDLFGLLDLVAVRGAETIGVQTTTASNFNARLNKVVEGEHLGALHAAGWSVVIHGWRKTSPGTGRACKHGKSRCACRWELYRFAVLSPRSHIPGRQREATGVDGDAIAPSSGTII